MEEHGVGIPGPPATMGFLGAANSRGLSGKGLGGGSHDPGPALPQAATLLTHSDIQLIPKTRVNLGKPRLGLHSRDE